MTDPIEDLRERLLHAEQIVAKLQEAHRPPISASDHESLDELDTDRNSLRCLNDNLDEEIANIVEREQRRIARDMHDSLGSLLTAIDLRLSTVREDVVAGQLPSPDSIDIICKLCHEAITSSRTLTRGLFPVGDDPEDLARALHGVAEKCRAHFPGGCRFECPSPVPIEDGKVANQLYRIAQEAANNASKHSEGKTLRIRLQCVDSHLQLAIEDDGRGFDSESPLESRPMGLRIMEHRARTIGAEFSIISALGQGTRILCRLPLNCVGQA